MNFESAREIERKRQQLKESRQQYLEKAKSKYEREERRAELAKQREEDKWMLTAVNDRLEREEESLKKAKKRKKDKKKKKHKKKEKKKKKRKEYSSSSDSSSDDDDEEEPQWVEKGVESKKVSAPTAPIRGPKLERDSWMEAPIDLFPTVTRQDLIDKKNKEKEEKERQKELMEKPGMYEKELNPYWKDGGTGLPEEGTNMVKKTDGATKGPGDGGLSWLRKSYQRCLEQAKEEGRSVEELAAERWGSLEKIQQMIHDAEAACGVDRRRDRHEWQRKKFMRPGDSDSRENSAGPYKRGRSRSPGRQKYSSDDRNRSRTSEQFKDRRRDSRSHSRDRNRRSRSRDRNQRNSRSRSRDRKQKRSRSRSKERRQRSHSRDRQKRSRSRERERSKDDRLQSKLGFSSLKGRFMKPGEMAEPTTVNQQKNASKHMPAWRKKEFQKPVEEETSAQETTVTEKRKTGSGRRSRSTSTSSSSGSSSEESESDSSSEEKEEQNSTPKKEDVRILSEKEMNELAAKILRAELMGNQEQAEKLKQQLEAVREAKKNAPAAAQVKGRKREADDEFVTLTRTDRSGLARPVPDRRHPVEAKGGRRRKKQKVETHTGKAGERTKYFDDDDKFDLKTMVEREKLGTAEDQNQMFARLAGRAAAEKTNDDFQVDDIFLSKANRKQSESIQEERDRAQAIFEHRKMAGALEKCNFCFNNVKKHLIIAIGTKVYLCLPETKSLTEGHCLIVPMQHVASGTAVDEDVWSEIQVFRKCLTKMFAERDEDVVFLETSMHLKHFPHMCLHCVPMEKEVGELAPIYFKKAIQESESEWSQNKKLVDLREKDVRHAIPKGFPYFAVDFGYQGGFAHVIEDERKFPSYFGQEIIGGMIDADHKLWRKPPRENFDDQRRKVLRFAEMWKPHDWTQNIAKKTQSDSDSD